jgi:hypothetical protein
LAILAVMAISALEAFSRRLVVQSRTWVIEPCGLWRLVRDAGEEGLSLP